jgi:hypothetical protein
LNTFEIKSLKLFNMKKIFTFFLSLAFTSVFAQSYPTNGLVAYFPFNGNIIDSMKYATLYSHGGASFFTDDRNSNLDRAMDAPSAYNGGLYALTQNTPNLRLAGEFTISMWVKLPTDINTYLSNATPTALSIGGSLNVGFQRNGNSLQAIATVRSQGNVFTTVTSATSFTVNGQWIHLSFKRGQNFYELFAHEAGTSINNFIQTQTNHSNTGPQYSLSSKMFVGYQEDFQNFGLRDFSGSIDDLFLYDRALGYSEIYDLFVATSSSHVPVCNAVAAPIITTPQSDLTFCTNSLMTIATDLPSGAYSVWYDDIALDNIVAISSTSNTDYSSFVTNPIPPTYWYVESVLDGCKSSLTPVLYEVAESAVINSITLVGESNNLINTATELCEGTLVDFDVNHTGNTVLYMQYDPNVGVNSPLSVPFVLTGNNSIVAYSENAAGCTSNYEYFSFTTAPAPDATITFDSTSGRVTASVTDADLYAWFDCEEDTLVFSSTSQNYFEPTITGSYYLEITKDDCSAISLDCIDFLAEGDTVIDPNSVNASLAYNVNIYPNPAKETIFIENAPNGSVITIADIAGKIVYTSTIINQSETINTNSISAGVYIIRIENNTDFVIKKLVVKN